MKLENTKIWIGNNEELSRAVYSALGNRGIRYFYNSRFRENVSFYVIYTDNLLTYGDRKDVNGFKKCSHKEIPAASLLIPEWFAIKINSKEEKVRVIDLLIGVGYKSFNGKSGEEYVREFPFHPNDFIVQAHGDFTFSGALGSSSSTHLDFTIAQLEEIYNLVNKTKMNKGNPDQAPADIKSRFPSFFTVESAGNPERKKIIYKMLVEAGYDDPFNYANKQDSFPNAHVYIGDDGKLNGIRGESENHLSFEQFVSIYHGIEEFVPKPKLPEINGHKGFFIRGSDLIKYGCAEIPARLFKDLNLWITETSGNRHVSSITLNSGVKISAKQIKEVCIFLDENT